MADELTFKIGDKVVLPWLGPDQPEGIVTGLRAHPSPHLLGDGCRCRG